ncbi:MAG TPA: hypothetical protein VMT46_15075 [Anaerolineaceae bacterium]|nr:hypothetical protein [Anaerolineaceae bacterium]
MPVLAVRPGKPLFPNILGWLLSAILSFLISQLMSNIVKRALLGAATSYGFTRTAFLIWIGVASVLSVLASILPARNATRLTIREVLAYE